MINHAIGFWENYIAMKISFSPLDFSFYTNVQLQRLIASKH